MFAFVGYPVSVNMRFLIKIVLPFPFHRSGCKIVLLNKRISPKERPFDLFRLKHPMARRTFSKHLLSNLLYSPQLLDYSALQIKDFSVFEGAVIFFLTNTIDSRITTETSDRIIQGVKSGAVVCETKLKYSTNAGLGFE